MTEVDTYRVRVQGCSRLRDEATLTRVSLPKVSALSWPEPEPEVRKRATPIAPVCADKAARIAMIRASHRKLARAGMFDHCEVQR